MKLNPYLQFDGDCHAAFDYYCKHLGGSIVALMRWGDGPIAAQVPAAAHARVMHAHYEVDGSVLMGTDGTGARPGEAIRNASVVLHVDDAARAEQAFAALADGGSVTMPLQPTFWAHRYGMVTDRFGVPWMINCEKAA